ASLSWFPKGPGDTSHMAVKLRLTRVGKTKQPQYRVIAADSRRARDGRFIEILGQYNPRTEPSTLKIDNDKAVQWLLKGAQPTERVKKLLEISGAWAQFTAAKSK
ncbi:MAG: 30S ribosomal protein S16, partial [Acidimicrobiales bacterium]